MEPRRVLFVNAVNPHVESQNRYPALGIGYLIAMLRRRFGPSLDIRLVESRVDAAIREFRPHLLAISSVSPNYNVAKLYASLARAAGIPVVMGGYHITELPASLTADMDVAVIGEGEYTICELLEVFLAEGSFPARSLAGIAGIAYWSDGQLVFTAPREVIGKQTKSLDELPMPARDLMRIRPHTNMLTSRGCPYNCTFCASTRFWPSIRYLSPEYMIEEVKHLIRDFGVRYVTFHDDLFIANVNRLRGFHELVLKEGLPKQGFRFSCASSATRITEEMARLLKEMNFVSISMGLESGNQEVLTRLKGPAFKVDINRNAVDILHRHGIHVHASFIIGESDETLDQMMQTYRFIKDNPFSLVNIYVLMPLPGTPVWHEAKARGLVTDDMDWDLLNTSFELGWRDVVLMSKTVSREELHAMYMKLRRLRLAKMTRAMINHPFQMDLAAYGTAKVKEWAHRAGILRAPTHLVDS